MTQQNLNFGTTAANDGEDLFSAFTKIQANFSELYAGSGTVSHAITDVASAATCDIGAATTDRVRITGSVTITSFGTSANKLRFVHFDAALTLTYNATTLILPDAVNKSVEAGDAAIFSSDASGNWRCLNYYSADDDVDSSDVTFTQSGTGAVERTAQSKLRESWISITDFGAVGDGTTNNQAAITAAIAASAGRWLYAPVDSSGGDYAITSGTLTIPSTCTIVYEGGARIYENGGTISDSGCSFGFGGGDTGESGRNRVTRGLNINILGGLTGTAAVTEVAWNRLFIDNDQFDSTTGGGSKTFGLQIQHEFGHSDAKGGRAALNARLFQDAATHASNTDRNYTASQGHVRSAVGDGGGSGTELGAYFGFNGYAELLSGATFTRNVTGGEFNTLVATGASTLYRSGIQIAGGGDVRGSTHDVALSVSNLGAAGVTWATGLKFGAQNGAEALGADSKVVHVASPTTISNLIDATGVTFTNGILLAQNVSWLPTSLTLSSTALSVTRAGTPATFINSTDAATNIALSIQSDRATPAANDRVGLSFALSDSAGNQDEFGRIEVLGSTVTSTSEAGQMRFHVITGGALSVEAILSATAFTPGANDGNSIGSSSVGWADLHLAAGGEIRINNVQVLDTVGGLSTQTATAAAIAAVGNAINTANKRAGKIVYDTTNNRLMVASGANASDNWYVADASASVTPA